MHFLPLLPREVHLEHKWPSLMFWDLALHSPASELQDVNL